MKQIIIVAIIAVLGVYCYGVTQYHGTLPVPQYKEISVEIPDAAFAKAHPAEARELVRDLARARYLRVPAAGSKVDFRNPLVETDYEAFGKTATGVKTVKVLDQSEITALESKRLHFSADTLTYKKGAPLDRRALEDLIQGKIARVAVGGHGETIAVQPGTMLMIVLIFIALLCALKIVLYDPLLKIMDERDAEITTGNSARRNNAVRQQELTDQYAAMRTQLHHEHQAELAKARGEAQALAGNVIREAREEAQKARETNAEEISAALAETRAKADGLVPALAAQMVEQVLGTAKGGK